MATKINGIVQKAPRNSPLFSSWLAEKGIDRKEQTSYVRSGYSHFVPMGKPTAYVFTEENTRIPEWMTAGDWDMTIKHYSSAIFGTDGLGLETITNDGFDLLISSPERAIMECLNMTPVQYSLIDTYYVMEMLTTLRKGGPDCRDGHTSRRSTT